MRLALIALVGCHDLDLPAALGPPSIARLEPVESHAGRSIRIEGANMLGPQGALPEAWFGPVRGDVLRATATEVEVEVPVGARSGSVLLRHALGDGESNDMFAYLGGGAVLQGRATARYDLPGEGARLGFRSDGTLFLIRRDGTALIRSSGEVSTYLLHPAVDGAIDANGRFVFLHSAAGWSRTTTLRIGTTEPGSVAFMEANRVEIEGRSSRLSVLGRSACVAMIDPPSIVMVDLDSLSMSASPLPAPVVDVVLMGTTCHAIIDDGTLMSIGASPLEAPVERAVSLFASRGSVLIGDAARESLFVDAREVPLPGPPGPIVSDDAEAFISMPDRGQIARVDLGGGVVSAVIDAPSRPTALALTPDGTYLVAVDDASGALLWFDRRTTALVRRSLEIRASPSSFAYDGGSKRLLYSANLQGPIRAFDPTAGFSEPVVAYCPFSTISVGAGGGWIAGTYFGDNLVIGRPNLWGSDLFAGFETPATIGGSVVSERWDRAFTAATGLGFVLASALSPFERFDGTSSPPLDQWDFRLPPDLQNPSLIDMSADETRLVVTEHGPPALVTLSLPDGDLLGRVPLDAEPETLAISPDGSTAWLSAFLSPGVGLYRVSLPDGPVETLDRFYAVGTRIRALEVSRNGALLYVGGLGGGGPGGFVEAVETETGDELTIWQEKTDAWVNVMESDSTGEVLYVGTEVQGALGGQIVIVR